MSLLTQLDVIAVALITIHFGVPLAYYYYAKTRWLPRPWNIKTDPNYKPRVTIIVPTYNEAEVIEAKLDNLYTQDYPRDKLEVIVVDSASTDGTPEIVEKWIQEHPDLHVKLIREPVRQGKGHALNYALKHIPRDVEVVVITDVDCTWPDPGILRRALAWLADSSVGAVSCLKKPQTQGPNSVEEGYRSYYNVLRLAESKAHSTPIFHGELAVFRRKLLEELGGFPTDIGSDDSHTATRIALKDCRAIIPNNIWVIEHVPTGQDYHKWRIRRAQHLIQHFQKTLKNKSQTPKPLKTILAMETYFHLINPWILVVATIFFTASALKGGFLAVALLALGLALLPIKEYRIWISRQLYLLAAQLRNLYTKELVWQKQTKKALMP